MGTDTFQNPFVARLTFIVSFQHQRFTVLPLLSRKRRSNGMKRLFCSYNSVFKAAAAAGRTSQTFFALGFVSQATYNCATLFMKMLELDISKDQTVKA